MMSGLFLPVLAVALLGLLSPLAVVVLLIAMLRLRRRVQALQVRLDTLERTGGARAEATPEPSPLVVPTAAPAPPSPEPEPAPAPEPVVVPPVPPEPVAPGEPPTAAPGLSPLEGRLGGTWLSRLGALILILGLGFFIKHAFENDWIGPAGRVGLGLVVGVALFGLGTRLAARRYGAPAQGLVAAGLGTLYLVGYAAHELYELVGPRPAFLFLALVVVVGLRWALAWQARGVALLSTAGGLLAPVLMATGADRGGTLFLYLALLDLGVLAVARRRRWPELGLVAFAGTHGLYWAWLDDWYAPPRLPVALVAAGAFLVIFALMGLAQSRERPGADGPLRRWSTGWLLILAAPTVAFLVLRRLLEDRHAGALALVCLGLAAAYLVAAARLRRGAAADPADSALHAAVGLAFLTAAGAVWLSPLTLSVAWSAQAAVLLVAGHRLAHRPLRAAGLVTLALAALRWWLALDTEPLSARILLDDPAWPATVALILTAALGARLYRRRAETAGWGGWEAGAYPALALLAVATAALFLTHGLDQLRAFRAPSAYVQVGITAVWTVAALPLLALARGDRTRLLLGAVTALLAAVAVRTLGDAEGWRSISPALRPPLLNARFLASLLLVVIAALYARVVPEFPHLAPETRQRLTRLATAVAALLLLWTLSAEVWLWPLPGPVRPAAKLRGAGLSILWTLYALALMAVGLRRRRPAWRYGAMLLFGIAVAKVLVVDLSALDAVARILSFIVVGAVLLVASFAYARFSRAAGGGEDVSRRPPPPA
jgi:uncharacterized membrane protein